MDTVTRNKTIKLIGINEAEIRTSILDLIDNEDVKIEIKPFDAKTYIILSADADTEEAAKDLIKPVSKEIKRRFRKYIYSTKEKITLEMSVVNLLEKNELTISTAESCTGGLLAGRLINVPGVSDVYKEGFITYTNKAKRKNSRCK